MAAPTNSLGYYKITYKSDIDIIQYKHLISHDEYLELKAIQDVIYDLEKKNKFKPTKESKELKDMLKVKFGDNYFTNKSPLFYTIDTNTLTLPKHQGGEHKVIITKIKL